MEKGTKAEQSERFVDKDCAHRIRKVFSCSECFHWRECLARGYSVAPSAKSHK